MSQPQTVNVSFTCSGCGKKFSAPSSFAGKAVKCVCGASVSVPGAGPRPMNSAPPPAAPSRLAPPVMHRPTTPGSAIKPAAGISQSVPLAANRSGTTAAGAGAVSRPLALPPHIPQGSWAAGTTVGLAILVVIGLMAVVFIGGSQISRFAQRVARTAARAVPAVRSLSPFRIISPAEADAVISQTVTNDISSKNVYQQMATYARGAMTMSSLVALSFGAAATEVEGELRSAEAAEAGTTTVHQQAAVYLKGMLNQLALTARTAGCTAADVESVLSQVRISDASSSTIHQQCASYYSGCLMCAKLVAIKEGAPADRVQSLMSGIRTGDVSADTVHQQNANYLSGLAQMVALAAKARGASDPRVEAVLQEMRTAGIGTTTVFQQEVTMLGGVIKCMGVLAVGN